MINPALNKIFTTINQVILYWLFTLVLRMYKEKNNFVKTLMPMATKMPMIKIFKLFREIIPEIITSLKMNNTAAIAISKIMMSESQKNLPIKSLKNFFIPKEL